jgi:hypothetical protein
MSNLLDELDRLRAEQKRWHTRDGALARGYRRGLRFRIAEILATPIDPPQPTQFVAWHPAQYNGPTRTVGEALVRARRPRISGALAAAFALAATATLSPRSR